MRVQHNIMAMNAYRNYTNNVSAMKKNLERLSSGYKINRAGDDAAGLAISEKMRAQITGLETAQKNAKDGISLVQTAEGALTEVHDMLNRMIELASQSANGTYDNDTDRYQLQKEVDQLMSEINRIADSSNFNGIQLLDGSMAIRAAQAASSTSNTEIINGMDRIIKTLMSKGENAYEVNNTKTILDSDSKGAPVKAVFQIDLSTMVFRPSNSAASSANATITINVGGTELKTSTNALNTAGANNANGIPQGQIDPEAIIDNILANAQDNLNENGNVIINGVEWTVKKVNGQGGKPTALEFEQVSDPKTAEEARSNFDVRISIKGANTDKFEIKMDGNDTGTEGVDGSYSIKVGTVTKTAGAAATDANKAHTIFELRASDIKDGTRIAIGTMSIILAVGGSDSKVKKDGNDDTLSENGEKIVNINAGDDLNTALNKIIETIYTAQGNSYYFEMKYKDNSGNEGTATFEIGVNDGSNGGPAGLTIQRVNPYTTEKADQVNDSMAYGFTSLEALAKNFKLEVTTVTTTEAKEAQNGLMLQIGDTADSYNQLRVSINDCHTDAIGIGSISIADQESAQSAIDAIRAAINYVSDVRGTLGATQNRLDHTINNLSVMQENIQDAESTIRDVDIAEEMMAYTKNNILIQSAQAMLAQANQVPQGVLQLLQ